uniref:site-specific integrase n=1 Tax=Desulfovibrio inopinatus TaxID=102109 RepID=UPI00054F8F73
KGRRGKYTGGHKYIFQMALSMLRAKTGYLWQKPEFSECLGKPLQAEAWHALCEKNRATLLDVYKELGKGNHFKKGRDPFHAIASIVALQHPIGALFEMVARMERSIPSTSQPSTNALHARNILLVKMLICNPLRVQQYAMMTWCADNTGNLYTGPDGEWRMRFEPVDFKNHYGAASQPYDVALSEWLRPDIDAYLSVYRPYFRDAAVSNSLFLPRGEKKGRTRDYLSAAVISSTVLKLTRKFIPDCPGFSAHAFRHIIATEYIKNNPNGFQVAANILHDRLETVMRAYAHLKVADGFSFWTAYLDRQIGSYQTQGAVNE